MPRIRKTHSPALKAKVAVEAIKEQRTVSEIAQTFSIHPNLVSSWKRQALELLPEIFTPPVGWSGAACHRPRERRTLPPNWPYESRVGLS